VAVQLDICIRDVLISILGLIPPIEISRGLPQSHTRYMEQYLDKTVTISFQILILDSPDSSMLYII
jgi:hypothetical protein